jgi:UDP:flavonoid glycosyltransferase YjiC (YdhE family)
MNDYNSSSNIKVLFIPLGGTISHTIPLIALSRMIKTKSIKTAFLLPRRVHQVATELGLNVLDIDYDTINDKNAFRTELRAYNLFSPDVVIDDTNFITGFVAAFMNLSRVTIQRTGIFPGSLPCNPRYRHSLPFDPKNLPDVTFMGLRQPRTLSDMFNADYTIVPGIPSIELLPPSLRSDPTYFFSGPLLLEDYIIEQVHAAEPQITAALPTQRDFVPLESFLAKNARRRRVYITFGAEARAGESILSCIRRLLWQGVAVVTNIKVDGISAEEQQLYYYAYYLPMNFVCAHVDLMIHQCGSGTYHYPILHQVPMITIGTQCFDREGVALRLEEIGASVHLAAPEERPDFEEAFLEAVERRFSDELLLAETRQRMTDLNKEISRTAAAFDLETILHKAVVDSKSNQKIH